MTRYTQGIDVKSAIHVSLRSGEYALSAAVPFMPSQESKMKNALWANGRVFFCPIN